MSYNKNKRKNHIVILILSAVLVLLMFSAVSLGTVKIPIKDVVKITINKLEFLNINMDMSSIKKSAIFIVSEVRLPRVLMSVICGGILAIVGVAYQAIFKNPMADPYIMGSSSGAAFGATVGIVLGVSNSFMGLGIISILAFAGALATTIIVYGLARRGSKISTTSILLAGIVMSSLLSSAISLMMIFNQRDLGKIIGWTMGSFNGTSYRQILIVIVPAIIGLVILISLTKELNALSIGEDSAQSLGVNVETTKKIVLVVASLLAACAVSVSGIIGFVGLIVPHLLRLIFGSDHRVLMPVSIVGGAIFMLICDTLARTVLNGVEIPVGIITSIFGGPFFLYLLRKSKNSI
ncbi:iron ABC transporter permease [Clostridiaceae bacterium M8S5]|nr:iron ABC transporter permease [Clostridiaceae bacterium M8S5]